jgi:hypothetical protein
LIYVRLDGWDGNVVDKALLDRKYNTYSMSPGSKSNDDVRRISMALEQNPGFKLTYELPTAAKARSTLSKLANIGITNINVRVRK